jgi:CRISPR system Cascade subunit CasA
MKSFNLIDRQWIPCLFLNGETRDLSLRQTLAEADLIREIFSPSPLITASLQRLLMALLWRVFPLTDTSSWKDLWRVGRFNLHQLGQYLDCWHERFDLLHPEKPFYQLAKLNLKRKTPLKRIAFEFASGNNGTLFDHSFDEDRPAINPSDVARWLVSIQCFAPSGGKSETEHTKDSPWSRGAIIFVQGDNLFQTLLLNLLGLIRDDFPVSSLDMPSWEREGDWQASQSELPLGIYEYLTWQSRAVRIFPDENGDLRECYLAQGRGIKEDFKLEPTYAYVKDQKAGLRSWQFNEARVLWRDSHVLFNLSSDAPYLVPRALHHLANLTSRNLLNRRHLYQLQVLGQSLETGKPNIKFWRNERLPLSTDYLNNKLLLDALRQAVKLSEDYAEVLIKATFTLARLMLEFTSGRNPDKKDVADKVRHWQPDAIYWAHLETPFRKFMVDLPDDCFIDDEEEENYGRRVMPAWISILDQSARTAFHKASLSLDGSSRGLKALAIAERAFAAKLNQLSTEMNQQK